MCEVGIWRPDLAGDDGSKGLLQAGLVKSAIDAILTEQQVSAEVGVAVRRRAQHRPCSRVPAHKTLCVSNWNATGRDETCATYWCKSLYQQGTIRVQINLCDEGSAAWHFIPIRT